MAWVESLSICNFGPLTRTGFHNELHLKYCNRALPTFVSHRKNWNMIYPLVNISDDEIADLKESSSYAAGFVDSRIENR